MYNYSKEDKDSQDKWLIWLMDLLEGGSKVQEPKLGAANQTSPQSKSVDQVDPGKLPPLSDVVEISVVTYKFRNGK